MKRKRRELRRRCLAWTAVVILLWASVPGSAATADESEDSAPVATTQGGSVALRSVPQLDADVLAELDDGTPVAIVSSQQDADGTDWYDVQIDGVGEGYVPAEFVGDVPVPVADTTSTDPTAVVVADNGSAPAATEQALAPSPGSATDTQPNPAPGASPQPNMRPPAAQPVAPAAQPGRVVAPARSQSTPSTPVPVAAPPAATSAPAASPSPSPTATPNSRVATLATGVRPVLPQAPGQVSKHPKLESDLADLHQALRQNGVAALQSEAAARGIQLSNNQVRVVIVGPADDGHAQSTVGGVGGILHGRYTELTEATVPVANLDKLEADSAVHWVRRPIRAHPTALSQGVAASGANVWQAAGLTGAGTKVFVLDGGFMHYLDSIASGDLPQPAGTFNFGCADFQGIDHGTQVAEVVHDMAPAATLYLACHGGGTTDGGASDAILTSGQAKDQAKALQVNVIQQSEGWSYDSKGDGTGGPGTMDAIVRDARAAGILWVASAGNSAQAHWTGTFSDPDNNAFENFFGADEIDDIFPGQALNPGGAVSLSLVWNDWPVTSQDYDLFLVNASTGAILAASQNPQTGTQPPTESVDWVNNTSGPIPIGFAIRDFNKANGLPSTTPRMDVWMWPPIGGLVNLQYAVASGSVLSPAYLSSSMAVAAVCWQNNRLESYSSQGPVFDGRMKPDIASPTDVNTTLETWQSCPASADGVGGFNGTSAAAPHVSGAAALVKGAFPNFTPDQVQQYLESHALDLGAPGKDPLFGAGVLALGAPPTLSCTPRPRVAVQATNAGGGRLQVSIAATGNFNKLSSLNFGTASNALIDIPGGVTGATGNFTVNLPTGTTGTVFYVRHAAPGATTVPLRVVDGCGSWPTFVGGGASAF